MHDKLEYDLKCASLQNNGRIWWGWGGSFFQVVKIKGKLLIVLQREGVPKNQMQ